MRRVGFLLEARCEAQERGLSSDSDLGPGSCAASPQGEGVQRRRPWGAWSPGLLGAGVALGVTVSAWHRVITTHLGTVSLKPQLYVDSAVDTSVDLAPNGHYGGTTRQ